MNMEYPATVFRRAQCVVFRKTREAFGGLSNMAAGYPLSVNGIEIKTVEHLYQACRFPHLPDVQRTILRQNSPMTAKMVGKPYRVETRSDWDEVRVPLMAWCLRLKLAQNWLEFSTLLASTGDRPIVEESRRDPFWGAQPVSADELHGQNVLGRLLVELRNEMRAEERIAFVRVEQPPVNDLSLLGAPIGVITTAEAQVSNRPSAEKLPAIQQRLFSEEPSLPC